MLSRPKTSWVGSISSYHHCLGKCFRCWDGSFILEGRRVTPWVAGEESAHSPRTVLRPKELMQQWLMFTKNGRGFRLFWGRDRIASWKRHEYLGEIHFVFAFGCQDFTLHTLHLCIYIYILLIDTHLYHCSTIPLRQLKFRDFYGCRLWVHWGTILSTKS